MTGTAIVPILHSELGASVAKRFIACAGSVAAVRHLPKTSSIYADEGTAAHALGALCLSESRDALEFLDRQFGEFTVDDGMAAAVQVYLDTVRAHYEDGDILFVEEGFSLDELNPPGPMWGTCDCAIYKPKLRRLLVLDYKHGQGVSVDAAGNAQTRYYGLGAALKLKRLAIVEVELFIVQPRANHRDGPVRSELVDAFDLIEWSGELLMRARMALDPAAKRTPGPHCRDTFCGAFATCKEARQMALTISGNAFDGADARPVLPKPEEMTVEEVALLLDKGSYFQQWYKSVYGYAIEAMKRGIAIPGWKLVPTQPRRHWLGGKGAEEATATELRARLPAVDPYLPKLKSPAQIEKSLKKKDYDLISDLYEKVSSGATLAPESDARQQITTGALLEHVFSEFNEETKS